MNTQQNSLTETLIEVAEALMEDKTELIVAETNESINCDTICARVALSVAFTKRPKGFQLRALVENWNSQKLVREMY